MAFVRSWVSETLRAGIVVMLLPLALLAALAIFALGSGSGGVASLGQLVVGPRLPVALGAAAPLTGPVPRASVRFAVAALPRIPIAPGRRVGVATPRRGAPASSRPTPVAAVPGPRARSTPPVAQTPAVSPSQNPRTPASTATSVPAPTPAPPSSPPTQQPGVVSGVASQVQATAQLVAGPAAQPANDVISTVVQLVAPPGSGP